MLDSGDNKSLPVNNHTSNQLPMGICQTIGQDCWVGDNSPTKCHCQSISKVERSCWNARMFDRSHLPHSLCTSYISSFANHINPCLQQSARYTHSILQSNPHTHVHHHTYHIGRKWGDLLPVMHLATYDVQLLHPLSIRQEQNSLTFIQVTMWGYCNVYNPQEI